MRIVVHLAWRLQPAHDPDGMRRVNVVGTSRVLDAIARAGVPALVHASSVGPTPPGPPKTLGALSPRVRENHPTLGISTSTCSRHKAEADRMLGASEAGHPERRGVRLRPGVVLQAEAASALARCFLGLFVPQTLVRPSLVPLVPAVDRLALQVVHAQDMSPGLRAGLRTARHGGVQHRHRAGCSTRARWPRCSGPAGCRCPRRSCAASSARAGSTSGGSRRCWTPRGPAPSSAGRRGTTRARPCRRRLAVPVSRTA